MSGNRSFVSGLVSRLLYLSSFQRSSWITSFFLPSLLFLPHQSYLNPDMVLKSGENEVSMSVTSSLNKSTVAEKVRSLEWLDFMQTEPRLAKLRADFRSHQPAQLSLTHDLLQCLFSSWCNNKECNLSCPSLSIPLGSDHKFHPAVVKLSE